MRVHQAQPVVKTSLLEGEAGLKPTDDALLAERERAASNETASITSLYAEGAWGLKTSDEGPRTRSRTASSPRSSVSEWMKPCTRSRTTSSAQSTVSSWMEPPMVRVGQTVTTVQGLKGRVASIEGDELQVVVPGFAARPLVSTSDLIVRKVVFLGGHGFNSIKRPKKLFCSCLVRGEPSSEVRTSPELAGNEAKWQHQVDILGYSPGDRLTVRLWGKDKDSRAQPDRLLGEASLVAEMAFDRGFDTQVQLTLGGQWLKAYLNVMVVRMDTPHTGAGTKVEEESGCHCEATDTQVMVASGSEGQGNQNDGDTNGVISV